LSFAALNGSATQTVTLAWDANGDPQTAGYLVYSLDDTGNRLGRSDVGLNTTATLSSLVDGATYVFHVTAYGPTGQESQPSNDVTYHVVAPQNPPVISDISLQLLRNQSVPVILRGSGTALTYKIITGPSHGSLKGAAPFLTYTPNLDFYGYDSFTYQAEEGSLKSAPATVQITVQAMLDGLYANSQSIQTLQNHSQTIALTGTDGEGGPVSFSIISGPTHGVLTGTAPNLTYTPVSNYLGTDTFRLVAKSGNIVSAPATISISVVPANGNVKIRRVAVARP
jgi:hypothetical protein